MGGGSPWEQDLGHTWGGYGACSPWEQALGHGWGLGAPRWASPEPWRGITRRKLEV